MLSLNIKKTNKINLRFYYILKLKWIFLNFKYFIFLQSIKVSTNNLYKLKILSKFNKLGFKKIRSTYILSLFKKLRYFNFLKVNSIFLIYFNNFNDFFDNFNDYQILKLFAFNLDNHFINSIYLSKIKSLYDFYQKNYIMINNYIFNFIYLYLKLLMIIKKLIIFCLNKIKNNLSI